jgi:hypothetical protein
MEIAELQSWVRESYNAWEAFLDQVGTARMEKPGVAGHWSMKDIIAHLTGWHWNVVARLRAALHGEPEPLPPWPAGLQTNDDDLNAWFYEQYHDRSIDEVLGETQQLFQQLFTLLAELPADARVETIRTPDGRSFYLLWVGENRFPVCEFFDHFRDDHEQGVRDWLAQQKDSPATHA